MAKFPTYEEMGKKVAEKALDEFIYDGRSIREWMQIIASEDCISRQEVLDILKDKWNIFSDANDAMQESIDTIEALSPVTPQPKIGQWIKRDGFDGDEYYDCSECGESFCLIDGTPTDNLYNYCPNCGAKLTELNRIRGKQGGRRRMTEEDNLYADELRNRALADYERLDLAINELERQTCDSPHNNLTESSQDCISREAVGYYIQSYIHEIITESGTDKNEHTNSILRAILNGIKTMPSVTPKAECMDCISRKQALKETKALVCGNYDSEYIVETLKMLPPVTPKAEQKAVLDKIIAEIWEEAEYAYADFDRYKEDILHAEPDELPDDDFRYGLERAVEIINKYKAESEGEVNADEDCN